jgi:hypothetical protein
VESTIIDCTGDVPKILRPGAITAEMITASTGLEALDSTGTLIRTSGSLDAHYAPAAQVLLDQQPSAGQGFIALVTTATPKDVIRLASPSDDEEFDGLYITGAGFKNSNRTIKGTPYTESANGQRWTNTMNQQKAESSGGGGPKTKPKKSKSKSYQYLKDTYGDGEYPAEEVDGYPGRFVVAVKEKNKAGVATGRYWYKANRSYAAKQYTSVNFPLGRGTTSFLVHKKIAGRAQQAAKLMTERKLGKFVKNIGGSIAVRNTTTQPFNDRDLSRHAWGLAVDVNSEAYQYGTRFSCDFKQIKIKGKWRDVDADDIGFLKIAQCFIEAGFGWLGNCSQKDAMHFSIDEGGYTGAIQV